MDRSVDEECMEIYETVDLLSLLLPHRLLNERFSRGPYNARLLRRSIIKSSL